MKKLIFPLVLIVLLAGCAPAASPAPQEDTLTVVATTYPVFLLAQMVTEDVEGITLVSLINEPISCPHDYTLTVTDMMTVETADVLLLNGAGLELFLDDILESYPQLPLVDCSEGISLLAYQGHSDHSDHDHDHEDHDHGDTEYDPHIWLDPTRAAQMAGNIAAGLSAIDPEHAPQYQQNAANTAAELNTYAAQLKASFAGLSNRALITFHDGFGYLADACDLTILCSIEEEAGSEASAQTLTEIAALVNTHQIPAIFCEENGSDSAAQIIHRETGVSIFTLSLMMSGETEATVPNGYYTIMDQNAAQLQAALQ